MGIIAGFVILLGFFIVAGSIGFAVRRMFFIKSAAKATGVVIDQGITTDNTDNTVMYYPIVRFQTLEGRVVDASSSVGTNFPRVLGEQILVNYNAQNPQSFVLGASKSFRTWLPSLIFGVVGGFMMLGGGLVLALFLFVL